jgi:hypothetical protein
MTNRYSIRPEALDSTLEDAILTFANKRDAFRIARKLARTPSVDVYRWHVEDSKTELSILTLLATPYDAQDDFNNPASRHHY